MNVNVVFVVFSFHILPKPLARMMDTENPMAIYTASHCTRIESGLGELTSRTGAANTTKTKHVRLYYGTSVEDNSNLGISIRG